MGRIRARTPAQQKDEEQREGKDMTSTINRRSFLKWAAAAGGTAALSSSLLCTTACSADAAAEGASDITANVTDAISDGNPYGANKIVPVICTCGDVCGMVHTANAYVKDGAIVYYEGNADGNNAGHLCPRGMAGLEIINSPNRIKYPMRRTNEKGVQGEFERISWDEAIETVTDAIVTAINESGPRTVAFGTASAHPGNQMLEVGGAVMRKLFNFDTGSGPGGCWNDLKIGPVATLGDMYHALEHDPFHSKLIIFWGDNSAMAKPQEWGASWGEAKFEHGAKIVSIESRISETSEKADIYLPVRPGTDSYLAMAMANVIITEGLQDQEFIDKYTVGYEEFKEVALRYTPELVEQITWTPADKIREVARLYATTKPAMIEIGRGGNQTGGKNSDAGWMMGRAVTCLIPLCGQVGVRGSGLSLETSVGAFNGNIFHWNMGKTYSAPTNRVKPLFETDQKAASGVWGTSKVLYERDPYGYRVFVTNGNVAGSTGDYAKAEAAFKQMDLVVMHNRIINWTGSAFADILLPACSWAEEYVWRPDWEYSGVSAPAIDPMFECRNDLDIFRTIAITLANKLNLGLSDEEVWPWATDKDFMAQILCNDDIKAEFQKRVDEGKEKFAPFAEGDIDFIASQAFGVPNPYYAGQEEFLPYQAKYYTNNGAPADDPEALWFPTDGGNGKALFKADFLTTASNGVLPALPIPCEPQDSYYAEGNPIESGNWELSDTVKNGYDFVAVGKAHQHWQFLSFNQDMDGGPGSRLLREAFETASTPSCLLNPADAERLGVEDGDTVTIESLYGKIEGVNVILSQTVMPKTVAPPAHWAPAQTKLYPYSLSLERLDPSVRGAVLPPVVGPFSDGGTKRTSGGAQNCQSGVLCKVYKA